VKLPGGNCGLLWPERLSAARPDSILSRYFKGTFLPFSNGKNFGPGFYNTGSLAYDPDLESFLYEDSGRISLYRMQTDESISVGPTGLSSVSVKPGIYAPSSQVYFVAGTNDDRDFVLLAISVASGKLINVTKINFLWGYPWYSRLFVDEQSAPNSVRIFFFAKGNLGNGAMLYHADLHKNGEFGPLFQGLNIATPGYTIFDVSFVPEDNELYVVEANNIVTRVRVLDSVSFQERRKRVIPMPLFAINACEFQ